MKVLHVSTGDFGGGAFRAAYRIHAALLKYGIDSRMRVLHSGTGDDRVVAGASPRRLAVHVAKYLHGCWLSYTRRHWSTDNPVWHTFGEVSAGIIDELNASDADVLNLHWISGLLSVADIGRLRKPIVWTFHDMWAFCGGEHYAPDDVDARFRRGYRADNRPSDERGPDLNRQTWEAKARAWARQRFTVVTPSHWLADCARDSVLFRRSPVHVFPYSLDTAVVWRPIPRDAARSVLGLPQYNRLVLFGADGGTADPRKGGDLLREAIYRVAGSGQSCELMVYGQSRSSPGEDWPCPVHWLGVVRDDRVLALAYSAADVMIVPSRQDNLPNTAVEAQACGTPVAAFDVGGLPDIVTHRETGWLAKAFDSADLASGIAWLLADETRRVALSASARRQAAERFDEGRVARQYVDVYQRVMRHDHR